MAKQPFVRYNPALRILTGSLTGAVALSQLLGWAFLGSKFWKRDKDVLKETGLSSKEWRKAKAKIKALPFVQITIQGRPIRTWYEFDLEEVKKATQKAERAYWEMGANGPKGRNGNPIGPKGEMGGANRPKGRSQRAQRAKCYIRSLEDPEKNRPQNPADGDSEERKMEISEKKKQLHPRWLRLATRLGNAIQKIRKMNVHPKRLHTWALAIRKLNTVDAIPPSRIRKVLRWYCDRLEKEGDLILDNSSFIPIAYSGQAFRDKFTRIEDAIKRTRAQDQKKNRDGELPQRIRVEREEE